MVRDAAMQTGCRVVLGAGWTGLGDELARGSVLVVGDVDHQALFPRTRGVVHHGGSGTTHTAARAGVPQLVLPQLADQFYWGHRVAELGLGPKPIAPGRLTVARLAGAMRVLLHESAFARQAATLGEVIRAEGGVEAAADAIEVAARRRSCADARAATPEWPRVTPLDVERSVTTG
jgi:sterol 3beta-glucosyltransferase